MIPTGNITFLFTDIEGSTKLAQEFPNSLPIALEKHYSILRESIESNNGFIFEIIGDAFCSAFANADDAVKAAYDAQIKLNSEKWNEVSIKVRMGIHSGNAEWNGSRYMGYITLARTQRVMSAAYGEQILISNNAYELVKENFTVANQLALEIRNESSGNEISFRDLGERRLKDLIHPTRIYQIISSELPSDFPPLKTLDARPNNLPVQLTSFIGREEEMKHLKILLRRTHLLTLTGSGGAGKTRLALQVTADVIDDFANGVWFAELASLLDPVFLPQAIAQALGVKEEPKRILEDTLCEYLREKEILLILDNCEHLIEACAKLTEKLLNNSAKLKIIATSREGLRSKGEQIYFVSSLSFPDFRKDMVLDNLAQYESVKLFIERAKSVQPNFEVNNNNAPALAGICQQLDGIPLAIELAAARVKVLSLVKIYERLNNRFKFLTDGTRTALPRQQTLKAMIDWSYELLSGKEKILWNRLSVFSGEWTLDAAEAVCADDEIGPEEVLDLLSQLIEKSLVILDKEQERYRMLETVKQYGQDKLETTGESKKIFFSHLEYYIKFSESIKPKLAGRNQKEWMDNLEKDHSNLQSALSFAHQQNEIEECLRLTVALCRYWEVRGYILEGRRWLEMLLKKRELLSLSGQALLLQWAGTFEWIKGDFSHAKALHEESLSMRRQLGDKKGIAVSLNNLGIVANDEGEYQQARTMIEESLILLRELGDKKGIADALINLGASAINEENYEFAIGLFEESLALHREMDDRWSISILLINLGTVAALQGNYERSRTLLEEGLTIQLEVGDKWGISMTFKNLGYVLYNLEDYNLARIYIEESLALKNELEDNRESTDSLNILSNIESKQHNFKKALELKKEVLRIRFEIGDEAGMICSLIEIAEFAILDNRAVLSAMLIGAAEASLQSIRKPTLDKEVFSSFERTMSLLHERLNVKVFSKYYAEGKAMTLEQAVELALSNVQ